MSRPELRAGLAFVTVTEDEAARHGYVSSLDVRPAFRGAGRGSALLGARLEACEDAGVDAGVDAVLLWYWRYPDHSETA